MLRTNPLSLYQELGIAFGTPLLQLTSLLTFIQRVVCQPTLITNGQSKDIINPKTAKSYLHTEDLNDISQEALSELGTED